MRLRTALTLGIPLACAAVFVRLGIWQLSRLKERRAFNAVLAQRLVAPPVDVTALPPDTALGHYRRVSAAGTLLYDREIVYTGRSHQESPGVDLLTPIRIAGHDTVVIVNRGWVYSPDAATVDFARWHAKDSVSISGYAETFAGRQRGPARQRRVDALDRAAIQSFVGLPIAPYMLVQTSDTAVHSDSVPARLTTPAMDEGPHESYAIQWFSFATIAAVGGVALSRRSR